MKHEIQLACTAGIGRIRFSYLRRGDNRNTPARMVAAIADQYDPWIFRWCYVAISGDAMTILGTAIVILLLASVAKCIGVE